MSASYRSLGHVKTPGRQVNYGKGLPSEPAREAYRSLPRFMANRTDRTGVSFVSEKTLADVASEDWQFYEPPSSFKVLTNAEISQKTAELKQVMQERNQLAIAKRLEATDLSAKHLKRKRTPLWQRTPGQNTAKKPAATPDVPVKEGL